ncbi:MAG: MBL fold metallo-hydrolase [Myxococcales bacterium]|nr:MBL fold metallo-hydrolase [Myxococcales bacterium]
MARPAPAATLILLRRPADPQVFWVRRHPQTSFLPGYHAFPGGRVDADEQGTDLDGRARHAALRETWEETGLALVQPPFEGTASDWAAVTAGRAPQVEGLEFIRESLSPVYLGRQFSTRYYQCWVPEGAAPRVDPAAGELDEGEWIRPADAVARWRAGEVLLAPPTFEVLCALAEGDAHGFAAHAVPEHLSPIRPHIHLLPLRTPTLPPATHTNTTVVGTDRLAVFDPASPYPAEQAILDAWLARRRAEGARVQAVVLTHHHRDHIADARRLADVHGAPLLAHPETAARVPFAVDGALDEGDVIELGEHALDVFHTPGHAPGHLVFVDRATRTAIVGDMVAGLGTILIEPGDGDMAAYLAQLARMRGLGLSALIPAHGNVIGGPDAKLAHYIAHRLAREAKVLAALREGAADVATLVGRAYAEAPPMARVGPDGGIAGLSLRAHLEKLLAEGLARDLGDGRFAAA